MNVIDMGVCLQGECQTDDVSDWQEGRHCVHQRPDKSEDTAAEGEKTRVILESLKSSNVKVMWPVLTSVYYLILAVHFVHLFT